MREIIFLLALVTVFSGCGGSAPSPDKEKKTEPGKLVIEEKLPPAIKEDPGSQPLKTSLPVPPQGAASITGVILFEGEVPKFKEIKMDADPVCLTHHSGGVLPQTLVLGENKTMANVFVRIAGGLPKKQYPPPSEEAVLNQKGCIYDPHVLGVMTGQPLKILNPDGTLHNIHALSKINPEFNVAMPKFRKELKKSFEKEEYMFPVKCDVHPWMGAWIAVMAHPYFSVTQADGKYSIGDLPPGVYEIEAWHEKLGTKKELVTLGPGETKEINFIFLR